MEVEVFANDRVETEQVGKQQVALRLVGDTTPPLDQLMAEYLPLLAEKLKLGGALPPKDEVYVFTIFKPLNGLDYEYSTLAAKILWHKDGTKANQENSTVWDDKLRELLYEAH